MARLGMKFGASPARFRGLGGSKNRSDRPAR